MKEVPYQLPTRVEALTKLRAELPGKNLYDLAQVYSVPILCKRGTNKGWVGQVIERAAGLENNVEALRDGVDFELKSTSLLYRDGLWIPKETIKITQLNPKSILEEAFETSTFWQKLSRLILVGCHHRSPSQCDAVHIGAIDILDPQWIKPIQLFWEDVRETILSGEIGAYSNLGSSESLIQLRPTGDGKQSSTCPITGEKFPARAFYATKKLITHLLSL